MLKQRHRIRSVRDVKYSVKGAAKVLGHVKDFQVSFVGSVVYYYYRKGKKFSDCFGDCNNKK